MKIRFAFFLFATFFSVLATVVQSQPLDGLTLIAHYPLVSDANDATGNNPAMTLNNTPFRDGGIYCNGYYINHEFPVGCAAYTPVLDRFTFGAFAISAKFKVDSCPSYRMPVFVAGTSWRWLGFYLWSDTTVRLLYNDGMGRWTSSKYRLNTWQEVFFRYDSSSGFGRCYLDGTSVDTMTFTIVHGTDKNVAITHYGDASTFKGLFGDLKIYSKASAPTAVMAGGNEPSQFSLFQNYPNPFNPSTTITYSLPKLAFVTLSLYDLLGREVKTLTSETRPAGRHEVEWKAEGIQTGVYFYRLSADGYTQTKKLTLIK
jgi:hypothetical protein